MGEIKLGAGKLYIEGTNGELIKFGETGATSLTIDEPKVYCDKYKLDFPELRFGINHDGEFISFDKLGNRLEDRYNPLYGPTENKKESEEMQILNNSTHEIVKLYYANLKKHINIVEKDIEKEINENKELRKEIEKFQNDISKKFKDIPKIEIYYSVGETPEQTDKINILRTKKEKLYDFIEEKKEEVITMLSACETYDQEMEILRDYGIIEKDSKKLSTNYEKCVDILKQ